MFTFSMCVFIWWASGLETCIVVRWEGCDLCRILPSACAGVAVASRKRLYVCQFVEMI